MSKLSTAYIIERAALAAYEQLKLNPMAVMSMQLFAGNFFDNTRKLIEKKHRHGSWCLRDGGSHAALFFNAETNVINFVEQNTYWNEYEMKIYTENADRDYPKFLKIKRHTDKLFKKEQERIIEQYNKPMKKRKKIDVELDFGNLICLMRGEKVVCGGNEYDITLTMAVNEVVRSLKEAKEVLEGDWDVGCFP